MYESPINILHGGFEMQIENDIVKAVQRYGIDVNKEELVKALNYDREQYDKGFNDGLNAKDKWIPCDFKMPYFNDDFNDDDNDEYKEYLVTTRYGSVLTCVYGYTYDESAMPCFHRYDDEYECYIPDVIAWMEMPKPYKSTEE